MQRGRSGRLNPVVARARRAVARSVEPLLAGAGEEGSGAAPLILVACSGGADSLALAAATAHLQRRGKARVGAVVVDHQLQEGSAEVAARTACLLRDLGLDPVAVERVDVRRAGTGPEMAARLARYEALRSVALRTGAVAVLLGHTRDDQSETVLLGLTRGSGTRSLSGMPGRLVRDGVRYLRPLLNVTRAETETVCAAEGLEPWHDPTNGDTALTRSRIRHEVLPYLEAQLGPGVCRALARTASVLGADADYLDEQAAAAYDAALVAPSGRGAEPRSARAASSSVVLDGAALQETPAALRRRVLARACVAAGGETPTFERLGALEDFALGHGAAGPVQMAGKVTAWRHRADAAHARGRLELRSGRAPQETTTQNNPGSAQ
ncbi:tRNA lysidine(34) synthetase TilS [Kocuria sp.]|uniref:tRNA lysidine(34) synthetase TilS n=1 Tax=Kocuria sp. TaxID=1871328 RepID=UPI0026DB3A4C|nr:tRNA lysidine(34) synthetase TilS [Kocuria sp.]MDO4919201.1 tRNA lysidine(34) synthetase TilS [Kocuria sp.]